MSEETKEKKIGPGRLQRFCYAGVLLGFILALQMLRLPNIVTGVVVNAVFIIIFYRSGLKLAVASGMLSPFGGVMTGHMPVTFYPLIPVIILGNVAFILGYGFLEKKTIWIRVIFPAFLKAMLIGIIGLVVIKQLNIGENLKWAVGAVLGIQFFTATIGVLLAEKTEIELKKRSQLAGL